LSDRRLHRFRLCNKSGKGRILDAIKSLTVDKNENQVMSALIGVKSLSKSFGSRILFEDISFTVCKGDRIGLLGPNGAGKTSLLKILMDIEPPDSGEISLRKGVRVGYASQVPEFPSLPVEEVLIESVPKGDFHELQTRARVLLGKAQFSDFMQNANTLSGGWKKRLDILRALMMEPELLLLDEPTNHLDLEGILWLESFLSREALSYMIVSHDRYFLEATSNKIIELNRCFPNGLFESEGNMSAFMEHKQAFLEGQAKRERGLASSVREEVEWLRKSPKARTTKSQSRIQRAYKLIDELSDVKQRNKKETAGIQFSASERATRKLLVANNVTKSLGGKLLFKGVNLTLSPGTRLGIVGKNGTGKTTLLKVLAGMIPQDMGTIKQAEELKIVYFDQHREKIPMDATLKEALCPMGDQVNYRGQWIHVNGWAKKFLFDTDRMEMPVSRLSGGERARILIARLMLQPADVLFLDEPTNDLDIPTLEVIEESLQEFNGAVVLITHDRCLMDSVCTQIIGLGGGNEQQLFADYQQWESACLTKPASAVKSEKREKTEASVVKMSYKDKKELEGMENAILEAETRLESLQKELESPLINVDSEKALAHYQVMAEAQKHLEGLYERWQHLLDRSKNN
jgi:ABC transport system ATP-binding/permease protein